MANIDEHIIEVFDAHKTELKKRFYVESLSVFGSVSRGTAGPDSDVDVLVRCTGKHQGFLPLLI